MSAFPGNWRSMSGEEKQEYFRRKEEEEAEALLASYEDDVKVGQQQHQTREIMALAAH